MLRHKKPSYSHLHIFGCLCYGSTLTRHCSKFSPQAIVAVFLSYPPSYKGYKLFDLITNDVLVSQDAMFHEHMFSFHSNSPSIINSDCVLPFHSSIVSPPLDNSTTSSRPHRTHKIPSYLQDYHCYSNSSSVSSTSHPFSKIVNHEKLCPSHCAFVHVVSLHVEQVIYCQAVVILKWREVMKFELQALENNGTWSITSLLPPNWMQMGL